MMERTTVHKKPQEDTLHSFIPSLPGPEASFGGTKIRRIMDRVVDSMVREELLQESGNLVKRCEFLPAGAIPNYHYKHKRKRLCDKPFDVKLSW